MNTSLYDKFSTFTTDHLLTILQDDLEPEVRQTVDDVLRSREARETHADGSAHQGSPPDKIVVDLTSDVALPPEEPTKWRYVGAWIIWGWCGNLLGIPLVMYSEKVAGGIETMNGFIGLVAVVPALEMALHYIAFLIVYRGLFSSLKVSRVAPWVYVLGTFGAIAGVSRQLAGELEFLREMPQLFNTMVASYVISWIVVCLLIRQIGRRQDRAESEMRLRLEPKLDPNSMESPNHT